MIVATAGHIDHGKTSLVKALTGIDADRLPEEKARGITLDLGFAYQRRGNVSLGFVDVPGHEKLVRTMVAGASGVDCALLVVAADDGVMPQTREHLAILDLLGLEAGLVAITKSDRVEPDRLDAVTHEVRALLSGTGLAQAPVLACSSQTGDGVAEVASLLESLAGPTTERPGDGKGFRLAVDRTFTLPGIGLVVTGAVHAGTVRVGDRLTLSPGDREVRVRAIRAQNEEADEARAGERCALNLTGPRLSREDVHRGDWVLAPHLHAPATRLDVRVAVLPSEVRPLRHRTPVQVHLGAASVTGRVVLLEERALQPGEDGLARLSLDAPIGALGRDRFVLRDISARRTLGGGRVIDPFGVKRGARTSARRIFVEALEAGDDAAAYAGTLAAMPGGLDLDHLRLTRNLDPAAEPALLARAGIVAVAGPAGRLGFPGSRLDAMGADLLATLDALHAAEPDNPGLSAEELAATLPRALNPTVRPMLDGLVGDGRLARHGALFHRPGHVVRLGPVDAELWEAIRTIQREAGLDQRRIALIAERLRLEPDELRPLLDKLGRIGWLRRVSKAYYLLPEMVAELARIAEAVAAAHPQSLLTVGQFRDAAGIGRNLTMPLLEHFDASGFTIRIHEGRRIRGDRRAIFGGGDETNTISTTAAAIE